MSKICPVEYCPSSQNKGNYQDGKCDEDLKNFFLICCEHEGTSKDQSKPVDGYTKGEKSIAKALKIREENIKDAEVNWGRVRIVKEVGHDEYDIMHVA